MPSYFDSHRPPDWYSSYNMYPHISTPQPTVPPMAEEYTPFVLCYIVGNISKCAGCGNKYTKPVVPPYDICIQHREWRSFTPSGGTPQSKFSNVYYHVNLLCIKKKWPTFSPHDLVVHLEVREKLGPQHASLLSMFGYYLWHFKQHVHCSYMWLYICVIVFWCVCIGFLLPHSRRPTCVSWVIIAS